MAFEPDEMMMQIFRSEVESHSETLTNSLLALEQDPTSSATLDRMMRAAHSIKGAARIVRVNPAVEVAHAMEDCFVAAQKGQLKLTPDDVDVLLRGVDLLVRISVATQDARSDPTSFEKSVHEVAGAVKRILEVRPAETVSPVQAVSGGKSAQVPAISAPAQLRSGVEVVASRGQRMVIRCPEVLNEAAAEVVRRQLLKGLEAMPSLVEIDLAATRNVDAIGLGFLAAARQFVAARLGTSLRFWPVSTEMQTVLQLTGLDASASKAATP